MREIVNEGKRANSSSELIENKQGASSGLQAGGEVASRGGRKVVGTVRATVPGHVTGFFAARREEDPLASGSIGCGFTLGLLARTAVSRADSTQIIINGRPSDAPVSRHVVDSLAPSPVRVETELDMVMGAGFGASGAGALSCAYALNQLFDLGLTSNQAASVAHRAEVLNGTGLGDVIAQNTGGLVIRIAHGAPGRGVVDRIPIPRTRVYAVVRGPIPTRDVLRDAGVMKRINDAGERAVKEILRRPTLGEFMRLSRRFTYETGLASSWAMDAIEAVESSGGMASMIMLGDSVFAVGGDECREALQDFGDVIETEIVQRGPLLD
ncbi:MAG: pantoate kinase [Methanothrix sp.]|uniref:pantoate kinase n=1 Tax=Methanothrix sp. TaxID=90426 RepID=UPI0032AF23F6|nr:pantoate kinase [Methanothrix sp.]